MSPAYPGGRLEGTFLALLLRRLVLPAVERCTRSRFWSYYRDSLEFDRRPDEARQALWREKLADIWSVALGSAFFRQRLARAGLEARPAPVDAVEERVRQLAPVSKAELRQHFPAGVTVAGATEDWRYVSTAGTADRMTVIVDFIKRDHSRSSELRTLRVALGADVAVKAAEIPPNACNVVCGLNDTAPPSLRGYFWHTIRRGRLFTAEAGSDFRARFERRVVHRRHTFPPIEAAPAGQLTAVLDRYIDQLAKVRPAYLRGLPVYLLWLADRMQETGRRLKSLRAVSPYGGMTSPQMQARIAAAVGAPFANVYGTSELGPVAASCGQSVGMHVFEDLFLINLVHHGKSVAPGEVGRLVVTDLTNKAMPLIRYDVGDVGRLHTGPCPCGRGTARLEVLGRTHEQLEGAARMLTASDVADTFFADPAVANFRLEEITPNSFEAAVVANSASRTPNLDAWRERFAALHGGVRRLKARLVSFVQPEPSGKYRFVWPVRRTGEIL